MSENLCSAAACCPPCPVLCWPRGPRTGPPALCLPPQPSSPRPLSSLTCSPPGTRAAGPGTAEPPPGSPLCALQEVRVPMSVPACVPMRAHVCRASLLCVVCVHMCACVCVCARLCVRVWACVPVCAHLWCVVHPGALRIPGTVRCHLVATPGGRAGQLPTPHLGRPQ